MSRPVAAQRVTRFATTVFSEFSALAARHGAVNLGQGFPDFDGPEAIKEAARRAIRDGGNQYAMGAGARELRVAIAEHSARFHGQAVDPDTMVTVTSGATEAILDTLLGLVDPGDEVVAFEPFYDSYDANITFVGATARFVPLRPPDADHAQWWFDRDEVRAAFGPRTRLLILNTPHNPTGKVFTRDELTFLGELCAEFDVKVLSDEVYEHIVFAPARHLRPATLPGLAERTVTVSSGGKTFSLTGWKVGWVIAPPPLRDAVQRAHQFVTFATAAPLQAAMAEALRLPDAYFTALTASYAAKRERLLTGLREAGLTAFAPEGSYFILADIARQGFADDVAFCRHLVSEVGVAAIPPSVFYGPQHRHLGQGLARFAFCKTEAVLDEAVRRLRAGLPSR
ncbi:aminotransferase class I/II-fold pyridoxal phosphate-dependent enzyme [Myxococcus sp. AM009]|uniref:aminotransferase class I/II-fold pyridoxal phosphate-dependent enzyme n=1 Tax=unclassified Myxococcus TaxID=2648731 RepID=UPI001595C087|nr:MULTISPECIES: aminotransferase class I/II-fold pyridoxal phosphate-dependent enzyme [unclassified Myxococcus]NVJ01595.1 aminotransferase class I/II-fold pyridoxal phosphate-dependent enzyme [Myxococcus sp. AM009]NVJ18216.1 aminotransferase class I/II-fold pyridoxal phosphate-dependent enzyme [Myxococcus sp. AM010]